MPIDRDSSTANLEQPLLQPAHGLQRVVSVSESGETEKSLASGSEPYTGGSYYIDFIKQFVKKFPRGESVRCFQPDVRSVFATIHPQAAALEAFPHDTGVGHVVIDRFPDLCFSFRAVDCFGTSLGDVARTVELRALAAVPHPVQRNPFACQGKGVQLFRDNRVTTTHTCETSCLGETAELDRHLFAPLIS